MASRRPMRLYQKATGIFCVRVLIKQESSGTGAENSMDPSLESRFGEKTPSWQTGFLYRSTPALKAWHCSRDSTP